MLPKTILVPVDFGAASEFAVDYAVALAKPLGADVVVMHAYEIPVMGFPDGVVMATAELTSRVLEGAREGLTKTARRFEGSGVTLRTVVKQGDSWRAIVDAVEEVKANLIVMGTHGRRGLPRALLGSVAEKVVRMAPCPVLTVHEPDKETPASPR